jgi:hypothetical protein
MEAYMTLEFRKAKPARLTTLGLNERWLQDRIEEDPSLLGLGDLQIFQREKLQPTGGRIDFVMIEPEERIRYEIEIMLGTLDESHIIRTIEYWDIERQRYPNYEHVAVIVAEEITSRFFNVIGLLNRAVPMIALQLNAFEMDNKVVLHFTKVLDVYELAYEEDETTVPQADRAYWSQRANSKSLDVADSIIELIPREQGERRVTYNKYHIAVGTSGHNFCWIHPRKQAAHCHINIRATSEDRDNLLNKLEEAGMEAKPFRKNEITLRVSMKDVAENGKLLAEIMAQAETWSRS